MCLGVTASIAMLGIGTAATAVTKLRGEPPAIWITLGYFTVMEALQVAGYLVIDQCGTSANQAITLLSAVHIAFQPIIINAFAMELVPSSVKKRLQTAVYLFAAVCSGVILLQLVPWQWAGPCKPGAPLCGEQLCLVSGEWHIAWDIPYNGLLVPFENALGIHSGFPTYILAVFFLPFAYGAWRFVAFHALFGPILAGFLTNNPNEAPAIWCLFSIGILLMGLSPIIRRQFETQNWLAWPKQWQN